MSVRLTVGEKFRPLFAPPGTWREAGIFGGRGNAKSWTVGGLATIHAIRERAERVFACRMHHTNTGGSIKKVLEDCIDLMGVRAEFEITEKGFTHLRTGATCEYLGLKNPENLKSLEGATLTIFEEAQQLKAAQIKVLMPTVLRTPGARAVFIWNPNQRTDAVDVRFRCPDTPRPEKSLVVPITLADNPHFFRSELDADERLARHNADLWEHVYGGGYDEVSASKVFPAGSYTEGYLDWGDVEPPSDTMCGLDWGWNDPLAVLKARIYDGARNPVNGKPILYVTKEVYGSNITLNEQDEMMQEVFGRTAKTLTYTCDTSHQQSAADLYDRGYRDIRTAHKPQGSIRDGLRALLGYHIVIAPDCVNLLREMAAYCWPTDALGNIVQGANPVGGLDHAIDALRYLIQGQHNAARQYAPSNRHGGSVTFVNH